MIVVKIILAAVIVLGGGYIGVFMASVFSVRIKQLGQLQAVIAQIGFNIDFLHMNISEAIEGASKTVKGSVRKIFVAAAKEIGESGVKPSIAMDRAFLQFREDLCLTKNDREIMREFALNLGIGDVESETNNIKAASAKLKLAQVEAEGEWQRRGKLWKGLGFLGGIFVAMMLL